MKTTTRRRMLSLTGAVAALAMPVTALAAAPARAETFTLIRSGSVAIIQDASGTNVYIRGGDKEIMAPGSAERLGALLTAVRGHPNDGVSEISLPAEGKN